MDVTQIQGVIRTPIGAPVTSPQLNERSEWIVAQGLPAYAEIARRGGGWSIMSTAAIAGLVVRPDTVAAVEIFNGYGAGGKSLVIDRLFWHNLVSTAVIEAFSGWAQVTAAKSACAATLTAIRGNSGKAYSGPVRVAVGTTVVDCGWFPWGQGFTKANAGVLPTGSIEAKVEGRLIVPPQSSLCLHVVCSIVTSTFTQGASWYEEQLSLE